MSYDLKLEPHHIEAVKENDLTTLVAALISYGNDIGLNGEFVKGTYFVPEEDIFEVITSAKSDN